MKIIIHNSKFEDNITFYADSIEEAREIAFKEGNKRGWKKEDCWSEVENERN